MNNYRLKIEFDNNILDSENLPSIYYVIQKRCLLIFWVDKTELKNKELAFRYLKRLKTIKNK